MTEHRSKPRGGRPDHAVVDGAGRVSLLQRMNNPDPQHLVLEEQLCFALYSATNAIIRTYRPWLRDIGLTYPQYLVLLVLWQEGERTMGEIATRLSLPPGGVTPIIERMEAAGLVARRRDEDDRRVVHVSLTPSGAGLEQAGTEAQRRVSCATGLPNDEMASLRSMLASLAYQLHDEAAAEPELAPVSSR